MNGPSGSGLPQEGRAPALWPGQWLGGDRAESIAVAGAVVGSLLIAAALQVSLAAALALIALVAAVSFVVRMGSMGVALLLAAVLPWLVVFSTTGPAPPPGCGSG